VKIEKLLESRYEKLRSIGSVSTEQLRIKTQAGRERIEIALQDIKKKDKIVPAEVR
jgi:hypothetical protein